MTGSNGVVKLQARQGEHYQELYIGDALVASLWGEVKVTGRVVCSHLQVLVNGTDNLLWVDEIEWIPVEIDIRKGETEVTID